MKVTSFLSTKP